MGTHPIFESDFDCLTDKTLPICFHKYTSILPLEVKPPAVSQWSFVPTSSQRQPRTSELSAPEKRDLDSPDPVSTESFPDSCVREVTSPTTTVPEASLSTATSSPTRTSPSVILELESSRWPTPVPTPTDPNSFCVPHHRLVRRQTCCLRL